MKERYHLCCILLTAITLAMVEARLKSPSATRQNRNLRNIFSPQHLENPRQPCATDDSGEYGMHSSKPLSIFYSYQMTVTETAEISELSSTIQNALIDSLLPTYFIECGVKRRRVEENQNVGTEILGVSTSPSSIEKEVCHGHLTTGLKCVEMEGHIIIYINEKYDPELIDTPDILAASKNSIKTVMNDGSLASIDSEIISVDFQHIALESFKITAVSEEEIVLPRSTYGNQSAGGIYWLSAIVIVAVGLFVARKQAQER